MLFVCVSHIYGVPLPPIDSQSLSVSLYLPGYAALPLLFCELAVDFLPTVWSKGWKSRVMDDKKEIVNENPDIYTNKYKLVRKGCTMTLEMEKELLQQQDFH